MPPSSITKAVSPAVKKWRGTEGRRVGPMEVQQQQQRERQPLMQRLEAQRGSAPPRQDRDSAA